MSTSYRLRIAGLSITCWERSGPDHPIVFIHGNSASSNVWRAQLATDGLMGRHRIIAFDLPGHGSSDRSGSYSLSTFTECILGVASALDCRHAVFVGHSLGGHFLLQAAIHLPQAAGFLIFGTPPLPSPFAGEPCFLPTPALELAMKGDLSEADIRTWTELMFHQGSQVPAYFADDVRRADGRMRAHLARMVATSELADELTIVRTLARPLSVLHGSEERIVNLAWLNQLTGPTLWRQSVQVVHGAGHYPQIEQPGTFDALVAAFAADCLPQAK